MNDNNLCEVPQQQTAIHIKKASRLVNVMNAKKRSVKYHIRDHYGTFL